MIKDFKSVENFFLFRRLPQLGTVVTPNQISVFGFVATLVCALLAANQNFAWASLAAIVHLVCDGLDGYVARKFNKSSQFGFLVDHILDRLSDLILFPVIGLSVDAFLPGLFVALVCLFSSYIGVLNKAIGAGQDKSGLFAKAYRYQLLIVLLFTFEFAPNLRTDLFNTFSALCLVLGTVTIFNRTRTLLLGVTR